MLKQFIYKLIGKVNFVQFCGNCGYRIEEYRGKMFNEEFDCKCPKCGKDELTTRIG